MKKLGFFLLVLVGSFVVNAQQDTLKLPEGIKLQTDTLKKVKKPLTKPQKAAILSAVIPGAGQVYNKKYWKIPIVLGGIGTGVGITIWNDNQYKKFRGYFIDKVNGVSNQYLIEHPNLTKEILGNAQNKYENQKN